MTTELTLESILFSPKFSFITNLCESQKLPILDQKQHISNELFMQLMRVSVYSWHSLHRGGRQSLQSAPEWHTVGERSRVRNVSLPVWLSHVTSSPQVEGLLWQGWAVSYSSNGYLIDLRLEEGPRPPVMPSCQSSAERKSELMYLMNVKERWTFYITTVHEYG